MKTKSLARKHGLLLLALCAAFLFIGGGVSADAKEILPTNVTTASSGCTLVGVEGSYLTQADAALKRINEIRKEACEEGNVPDPRNKSRNLTSSDYKEIKWSSDLEYIARIRAAEASLAVAHARPSNAAGDPQSAFEVKSPKGEQSWYEVLAWDGSRTMVSGIEQWYEEKADWVNQKSGAVTGHYTAMINPKFNYVAIAEFINTNALFSNTVSGEFSHKTGLDETKAAAKADIIQTVEILNSKLSASLSLETATLEVGATTTASIDFKANTYSTKSYKVTPLSVTYTSSDTSIATVSKDGTVTAKGAGTATITAKISDGISATATVTVKGNTHTWDSGVVTKAATCTETGVKTYTCTRCGETKKTTIAKLAYPKVGTSYTVGGNVYKVTKAGAEVAFVKAKANVKSLTIPATIRVSGITYKVTAINANAVKNNKKLKSAVIGANVKKIANGAFSKCKALKTVTFKTTLLTKKTASKKAFKSVHKKITLKVPKKVKASYKKIFKGMKVK